MNKPTTNVPDWKRKFAAELKRDKKKTAILGALVIVAGIVGGRLLIRPGAPANASAAIAPAASPAPTASVAVSAPPVAEARQTGRRDADRRKYIQDLPRDFRRDLFHPNSEYYTPTAVIVSTEKVNDKPSDAEQQAAQREQEVQAVHAQARALNLQSTMLGSTPTALVNDRVLRVGEWVNGFRVAEIGASWCVVEKSGVQIRLTMKN